MAGGRPKKTVTKQMNQTSESLEEVEHVSDECHELFKQLAAVDDKADPQEYARLEALYEEEWDRSIKTASVRATVFDKLKAMVNDFSNGLLSEHRKQLNEMMQHYFKESPKAEFFSEADWISRLARKYSRELLLAQGLKAEVVNYLHNDLAQDCIVAILTAGTYEYMNPKKMKAGYIKATVRAKVIDFLRQQNQTELKMSALRAVLVDDIANEPGDYFDPDIGPTGWKKSS